MKFNHMTRISKKDTSEARLTAVETGLARILEMLSEMSKTQTAAPSSEAMTEEQRQEQIDMQNKQLTEYCEKNDLVIFEVTGYSFKRKNGNACYTKGDTVKKADIDAILNCKQVAEDSGLNSGKMETCSIFPAEILKVE